MPRAFTDQEREKIRGRLVAAGKKLINRLGVRLLSVDELAREAGISKGSFYSFFPSREDFILAVFESWETEYRGALLKELIEGPGSMVLRFERFFLGAFDILEREPGLAKLGFKEIEAIIERLPPERIAAHKANDEAVLERAFGSLAALGPLSPGTLGAMQGLGPALFSIAIHREDFPSGSYAPTVALIAKALARQLADDLAGEGGDGRGGLAS
jgi:AcrR family transcriptional regulator